ncbi:uncharacterized protein LY89DRAFT_673069 [Mollisia scopiformis]|uniref:Uncharacterized protein n=1 Tax=Mollisia scopiformis TaxID=149040 RepID=A0A194WYF0_MOLSC|nr:uncharacterized protein LY89DRAFT_673069 [Mollisia scopiformis]KUJ12965.1 hypothetical protein LY89DRAFT_673069 [Mollisia scopiformis]
MEAIEVRTSRDNEHTSQDDVRANYGEGRETRTAQSKYSLLSESKDSISAAEHARMAILAILQSYLHNLRNGNLTTGEELDPDVAAALEDLLSITADNVSGLCVLDRCGSDLGNSVELCELSDEAGVVQEIKRYSRALMESGGEIPDSVHDAAQSIICWTML